MLRNKLFVMLVAFVLVGQSLTAGKDDILTDDILSDYKTLLDALYQKKESLGNATTKEIKKDDLEVFADLFEKYIKGGVISDIKVICEGFYAGKNSVMVEVTKNEEKADISIHWQVTCGTFKTNTFTHFSVEIPANDSHNLIYKLF